MRRLCLIAVVTCGITSAACSAEELFTGARDEPGVLIYYTHTSRVVAPDTVARGVAFDVSFTTAAGGCRQAIARDDVTIASSLVEIRPYDHVSAGSVCTDDLRFLNHVVPLRLDTPGQYVIRVIGVQRGATTGSATGPAELTKPVIVR